MSINNLTPDEHRIMVDAIHDSATVVHKGRMMNERIKELLESSIIESSQWTGSKPAITITYDTLDHFAQLIVRECISKIENEAAQYAEPVWAVELVNDIKEHFGVKE
jgi:hypothetical protein